MEFYSRRYGQVERLLEQLRSLPPDHMVQLHTNIGLYNVTAMEAIEMLRPEPCMVFDRSGRPLVRTHYRVEGGEYGS